MYLHLPMSAPAILIDVVVSQWRRVKCAGSPHFWVDADGSYWEEGQKNVKGKLWGKARTKLLCSFLSLSVPCKGENPSGEEVNNMLNGAFPFFFGQRFLFFLSKECFKSSCWLDMMDQEPVPYLNSIYSYLGVLLEGRERFEEETLAE
ncbi:uncharacterized protein A4U43_C05F33970 [Asparagus officinalis]|uniref:Uncharacterized protein n=1 Tax=Asparagus officinalis TaxID=4686 RepID=A0A5P1EX29_ASPOF|nr:uncharacterized protein A4U43_C05F33970 [Asparagus officinalis]